MSNDKKLNSEMPLLGQELATYLGYDSKDGTVSIDEWWNGKQDPEGDAILESIMNYIDSEKK